MDRREFIKSGCSWCLAMGAGVLLLPLASCSGVNIYKTNLNSNTIHVPIKLFDKTTMQMIRVPELDYDIALRKAKNGNYLALLLKCTHADNALIYTGHGYMCSLHGSTYDGIGTVKQGPAERPLKRLVTEVIQDNIVIHLG